MVMDPEGLIVQQGLLTIQDQLYRNFMFQVLLNLEPRREESGTILFDQNEEVTEMFFILKGSVYVGFCIDRRVHYSMRLTRGKEV